MRIRDMLGNGMFGDDVFITFRWENYYVFPLDYELGLLSLKCVKCIFIAFQLICVFICFILYELKSYVPGYFALLVVVAHYPGKGA